MNLRRISNRHNKWRHSRVLALCIGHVALVACTSEPTSDPQGSGGSGTAGFGGAETGAEDLGDAGGQSGDGDAEASGGSRSSGGSSGANAEGGSDGLADDGSSGEGTGSDASGGSPSSACADEPDLAPARERWTAYVAMNAYGQTALWAARSDAPDEPIVLHEDEFYPITSLRWSPDGRWLAFVDEDGGVWGSSLYVVDFDGDQPPEVMLVDDSSGYEIHGSPTWSPDSTRLVYAEPFTSTELRVIDVSSGTPAAPERFAFNCPQGAYADYPCLAAYLQPLRMEWSPGGDHLALVVTSGFFTEFGTGSAADLFLLQDGAPEGKAPLASPFVTSFDAARRGVSPGTFAWSPDGNRVAYAGSFEDTASVAEAYVFHRSDAEAEPIKLHADLTAPHEGTLAPLVWGSNTTTLFTSDLNTPNEQELFSIDVSDPSSVGFPTPEPILGAAGGSILYFALSRAQDALLVLRVGSTPDAAGLTIFPYENGDVGEALEVSSMVAPLDGGFDTSAQWSATSNLFAVLQEQEGETILTTQRLSSKGSICETHDLQIDAPAEAWHWLEDEASVVVLDAAGIRRLNAGSGVTENLSAEIETDESIVDWAVQP